MDLLELKNEWVIWRIYHSNHVSLCLSVKVLEPCNIAICQHYLYTVYTLYFTFSVEKMARPWGAVITRVISETSPSSVREYRSCHPPERNYSAPYTISHPWDIFYSDDFPFINAFFGNRTLSTSIVSSAILSDPVRWSVKTKSVKSVKFGSRKAETRICPTGKTY